MSKHKKSKKQKSLTLMTSQLEANVYCSDCGGLVWSAVPFTPFHFPKCSAHNEACYKLLREIDRDKLEDWSEVG